jgi:nucleotide-binding universal stress UspA family protein
MPEIHTLTFIPSKILSPIDFSSSSQGAMEMAADLAERFQAELYIVNVIPMFSTTSFPDFATEADYIQQARTNASNRLAKCHLALAARGVKSTSCVQVGNDIAGNIVEVVERENIELS